MRKIAIANRKGGVGKTTTAVHVAAGLALAGQPTLLIDTDTQGHCSRLLGSDAPPIAKRLAGDPAPPGKVRENLYLYSGTRELAGFSEIQTDRRHRRELILSESLSSLEGFEYVILDTPPGFSDLSVNVLFYADSVVIPVSMEVLAVEGLFALREEIEEIARYTSIEIAGIVPTFVDGRVGKTDTILAALDEEFGKLVTFPIHYSTRFSELPAHGKTIYEYDGKGRGSFEYAKVAGMVS